MTPHPQEIICPPFLSMRTGGQILVDQFLIHGVEHIFCVPGESYLPALDALRDVPIELTVCRQEGGVAMMAEAYGKLTGRPGVAFVTRGPGATNAAAGIHIAQQDSTPLVLLVGQVARSMRDRDAFQEVDYQTFFRGMAKWVGEVMCPKRLPEYVARAFTIASSGRPGPVVLSLPEDVLSESAVCEDGRPYTVAEASPPSAAQLASVISYLHKAEAPIILVGGSGWSPEACGQLVAFSEAMACPVVCSLRRQMLFPHNHPHYVGDLGSAPNPALVKRVKEADVLLLIGGRLSEVPSQDYTLLPIPNPGKTLIHVHPDVSELGRVYQPTVALAVTPRTFMVGVSAASLPTPSAHLETYVRDMRHSYENWSTPHSLPVTAPDFVSLNAVVAHVASVLPKDGVVCTGAGNYTLWVNRYFPFSAYGSQIAPTCGFMGYSLPAAVAIKRCAPHRTVVAFAGDGCFLMNGQEFATAVHYNLPFVVLVVDNGMYGTIRMHQERSYPGRVCATTLSNPDFAALARAYGGYGERVEKTEEFASSFARALESGKPALLHLLVDPNQITPTETLSALRGP